MDQDQLYALVAILKRHGWIVVQSVVVVAAVAAFVAARAPEPPYVATATLVYDVPDPVRQPGQSDPTEDIAGPFLRRQAQVLRSSTLLTLIATQIPGETVESLRDAVAVQVRDRDRFIELRSEGPEPALPLARVTAVAEGYAASDFNDITRPLRERVEELRVQLDSLEERLTGITERLTAATDAGTDTALLEAQQTAALNEYSALFASEQRILNQIALQRKPMSVLDTGTVTRGAAPNPLRRGILGAVIGGVLGAAVLTLRELLDRRLRSSAQAQAVSGLMVVAELPRTGRRARRSFALLRDPAGPVADAIRRLRTVVQLGPGALPIRSLAVTSPGPEEDRQQVSADLAIAFARAGLPTLLVSADRSQRRMDRELGALGLPGLPDAVDLVRRKEPIGSLEALLRTTDIPNLRILSGGTMTSDRAAWTLDPGVDLVPALEGMAEMVVIDCPPMTSADASLLTATCDATLVVATCGVTAAPSLQRTARQLSLTTARPLGLVVTRSEERWAAIEAGPVSAPGTAFDPDTVEAPRRVATA